MSKLDELVAEFCSDGVEIKNIEDICDTITDYTAAGSFADVAKNVKYINDGIGYAQLIRTTDLKSAFKNTDKFIYIDEHAFNYLWRVNLNSECLVLPNVGNCGEVYYVTPDILPFENNVLGPNSILVKSSTVDNRYLFHAFQSSDFQKKLAKITSSTGQTKFNKTNFKALSLPVPPLEVQREIVHILDSFTLLTAELTAELTARKKQYEFYRNNLLTFENNVKIVPLMSIADIGTGSSNTNEGLQEGKYPFYVRSQEPLRKNEYEYDETAIITAGDGVGVGKVFHYVEGKYALHQRAYRIHINTPDVLPKYFFHYMRAMFLPYIQKTMFQGSVASIRRPMLNQFPVPVPALDVQQRLVNVLDNFEAICTDLNIGLPAEIEARQKQYEYYRDLLLTFAETGSMLMTNKQTNKQTNRAERN